MVESSGRCLEEIRDTSVIFVSRVTGKILKTKENFSRKRLGGFENCSGRSRESPFFVATGESYDRSGKVKNEEECPHTTHSPPSSPITGRGS